MFPSIRNDMAIFCLQKPKLNETRLLKYEKKTKLKLKNFPNLTSKIF